MSELKDIRQPVKESLLAFEKYFSGAMKGKVPLLNTITRYMLKTKGKQMRPLFVFLSAGMCGGITDKTQRAATMIELLHTATLVHDDVVDDSSHRRGVFSINALWKNKIAVLIGDYLLSKGLLLAMENNDYMLLKIISEATREMSEGELLQIEKARRLDVDETVYFEIIRKKTASLIAACCACGAASSCSSPEQVEKFRLFGEKVGIAFQIKDDLFDYERLSKTGKPKGTDIKEKKMTLPLIYMLNHADKLTRKRTIRTVKYYNEDPVQVAALLEAVKNSGGIDYATVVMKQYLDEALQILSQMDQNEYAESMRRLVLYTSNRVK